MSVETSIHWHGLLVPPDMDGVPYVSFTPIMAGTTFTYEFPIRQSGTYWYHSHTSLQEQSGVYGSIVIEPTGKSGPKPDRDHVLMLSDWTDEDPHEVNRTLKRGSEWFATQKGSGQSILGAARLDMLGDYYKRELQRMPVEGLEQLGARAQREPQAAQLIALFDELAERESARRLEWISSASASELEQAGIDPTVRAETLSVEEFCRLARTFKG